MEEQQLETSKSYDALLMENEELRNEVDYLSQRIACLNRKLFGRTSEKLSVVLPDQQELAIFFPVDGQEESDSVVLENQKETLESNRQVTPSNPTKGRKPLPANLPRERKEYEPENKLCSGCGKELSKIGEEITEELEYIPARLVVVEHVRVKLACSCCKDSVAIGKIPSHVQPIEKGRPGAGLIAHIGVSKFGDHIPLTCQEAMFARIGISLRKQRMCDWLGEAANQLEPVAEAVLSCLLEKDYLQAEETRLEVQDGENPGKLHQGYLWAVHAPPNLVYYRYDKGRAETVPLQLFEGYQGAIQTDAYVGYNKVFLPDEVTRIGCWSHCRRKLLEGGAAMNSAGTKLLVLIAKLYAAQQQGKKASHGNLLSLRQKCSSPIVDEIFERMGTLVESRLPKEALRNAVKYCYKQEKALRVYLSNPLYQIDNNSVERMMKGIAVGRHNWLFAGSHDGGRRAAIFFTLINSCKLNNVNPEAYIRDLLMRLPTHPMSKIQDLLPHNWICNFVG